MVDKVAETAEQKVEQKIEPIRMSSSAVGEISSIISTMMVECIGEIEYYERAKLVGHDLPKSLTDYSIIKLRDLQVIRDAITSVFYYKKLDDEEAKLLADLYKKELEKEDDKTQVAP